MTNDPLKLAEEREILKLSKHAKKRVVSREVKTLYKDIHSALELAQSKGSKKTALITEDHIYVVAVDSKQVITVIKRNEMKQNIITNIDSAVVI